MTSYWNILRAIYFLSGSVNIENSEAKWENDDEDYVVFTMTCNITGSKIDVDEIMWYHNNETIFNTNQTIISGSEVGNVDHTNGQNKLCAWFATL